MGTGVNNRTTAGATNGVATTTTAGTRLPVTDFDTSDIGLPPPAILI